MTTVTHITPKNLALKWGHPDATSIYRMIRSGKLPAMKMGGRYRIPLAAVAAYEAANTSAVT